MTPAEFLVWERTQTERHGYVRGEIFAMAGGTPRHSHLGAQVIAQLVQALRGSRCDVHTTDLRLGLPNDEFVHADAVVVCRPMVLRPGTTDVVTNPSVVIEVLSKSTEAYDRGDKQASYLAMPSVLADGSRSAGRRGALVPELGAAGFDRCFDHRGGILARRTRDEVEVRFW